jgi:hypothetical protein
MRCIECDAPVTEQEMKERYEELSKYGIVPMLVPMCKECRAKAWDKREKLIVKRIQ